MTSEQGNKMDSLKQTSFKHNKTSPRCRGDWAYKYRDAEERGDWMVKEVQCTGVQPLDWTRRDLMGTSVLAYLNIMCIILDSWSNWLSSTEEEWIEAEPHVSTCDGITVTTDVWFAGWAHLMCFWLQSRKWPIILLPTEILIPWAGT